MSSAITADGLKRALHVCCLATVIAAKTVCTGVDHGLLSFGYANAVLRVTSFLNKRAIIEGSCHENDSRMPNSVRLPF
jgi:hypothetical protein